MTERPNIRRMQNLDHSNRRQEFDVDRDITPGDWKRMEQEFHDTGTTLDISRLGNSLLVLNPDGNYQFTEVQLQQALKFIEKESNSAAGTAISLGYVYNFLRATVRHVPVGMELSQAYLTYINSAEAVVCSDSDAELILCLFLEEPSNIKVSHIQWLQNALELWRIDDPEVETIDALAAAAALRCLGVPVTPTSDDWKRWKLILQKLREGGMTRPFILTAAYMKIIASDEVKKTNRGFELVMHKADVEERTRTMPPSLEL